MCNFCSVNLKLHRTFLDLLGVPEGLHCHCSRSALNEWLNGENSRQVLEQIGVFKKEFSKVVETIAQDWTPLHYFFPVESEMFDHQFVHNGFKMFGLTPEFIKILNERATL